MQHLLFSLNATIPIFLMMVLGYLLRRAKLVDESFVKTLNSLNFKFTLPFLLFRDLSSSDFKEAWDTKYVFFCFFVTLFCILTILFLSGKLLKNKSLIGEFVQASYRGSAAVLGIAFIQNIYGTSGMAPLMILATVPLYNVAAVVLLSMTAPTVGDASHGFSKEALKNSLINVAKNPIIWGIFLGALASFCKLPIPKICDKVLSNIAGLATPLALIGLGAGFEGRKALALVKETLCITSVKLFIQPLLFLPLAVSFGFEGEKLVALLVMLGAPTTASCYIMAKNMGHEGVLTSSAVVASTFLSSISLTLFLWIMRSMGLI